MRTLFSWSNFLYFHAALGENLLTPPFGLAPQSGKSWITYLSSLIASLHAQIMSVKYWAERRTFLVIADSGFSEGVLVTATGNESLTNFQRFKFVPFYVFSARMA